MSRAYVCSVSSRFPENYEIGVRAGKWGVEAKFEKRIAPVRAGDAIVFVVGGEFRSIHRVIRGPQEDRTLLWPPKDGDIFPYRIDIGPAEVRGRVPVKDLADGISFMVGKQWGGTIRGANGVFNDRLTDTDLTLIANALAAYEVGGEEGIVIAPPPTVLTLEGTRWLPALLDRLADLSELVPSRRFADPLADAEEWRGGLVSRVYTDPRSVPTLGVLPLDRDPNQTVLSVLYGLSSLKQSSEAPQLVQGVIFVPRTEARFGSLLRGLPNLASVQFDLQVRLRN